MKIYLDTVGCRLNQSEIETYAWQFRVAGHTLVSNADQADLVVVNTCAVTSAASADSRQKIRQASKALSGGHRARMSMPGQVVVTGCWSTLNPQAAASLEGVSQVITNHNKDQLVSRVLRIDPEVFDREFVERQPIPGSRWRTRAFIKVQDGCNNRCAYCVTTLARGPSHSRSIAQVLVDIQSAVLGGAQEVVLTGVHLGSWGQDFNPPQTLDHLVRAVLARTSVSRLRLSSLEPWDLEESFFSLWNDPRLCRHLHLPLQSGSGSTLLRMARKTTPAAFAGLVATARAGIPRVAITTDMIVGFPGETEAEFAESLAFVKQLNLAGGHVFTFSARPGTVAARLPEQVPHAIRKERNAEMRLVLNSSGVEYQRQFLGEELPVLWENAQGRSSQDWQHGWQLSGLTDNYLRVVSWASQDMSNRITPVHLKAVTPDGISGWIANDQD